MWEKRDIMEFKEYICEVNNNRVVLVTDIHYVPTPYLSTAPDKRMDFLCEDLQKEYENMPYDAILCLGDYSLDFWTGGTGGSYLNSPSVSNTQRFMDKVYSRFLQKAYVIAGNHEPYSEEDWLSITGFPRKYSIVYGDYVFLMCDTFGGELGPKEQSDGVYTGLDADFLKWALKRYKSKKFILCTHDLCPEQESEEVRSIVFENRNILFAFAGHTHKSNTVILTEDWRNLPVFYCGDYSYFPYCKPDSIPEWGLRTLELGDNISTQYKKYPHKR